jgi:hypothetical protein
MSAYAVLVGGVIVATVSAVLKYFVWDFFNKVQSLDKEYAASIAETHAAIHERRFLPIISAVCDAVAARQAILPAASTPEILTELSIDAKVREAVNVISDRIALDRSYRLAQKRSIWVAFSWLAVDASVVATITITVLRYFAGTKSIWVPSLLILTVLCVAVGFCLLMLYRSALNKFIRLLRTNPI